MNSRKTLLIVDDDAEMHTLIKAILAINSYAIVDAIDGEEAIDKINLSKPDLILLDLVLPKISGEALLEKMATNPNWNQIPVVLTSAKDDLSFRDKYSQVVGILPKPFTISSLLKTVVKHLEN